MKGFVKGERVAYVGDAWPEVPIGSPGTITSVVPVKSLFPWRQDDMDIITVVFDHNRDAKAIALETNLIRLDD